MALTARPLAHSPFLSTHVPPLAGSCGSGPNMALIALDGSAPLLLGHVGTPQRMADLLRDVCGQEVGESGREEGAGRQGGMGWWVRHGRGGCWELHLSSSR